jgi:hypothetical protein
MHKKAMAVLSINIKDKEIKKSFKILFMIFALKKNLLIK